MNAKEFVRVLKIIACQGGAASVLRTLDKPPGRSPEANLVRISDWFTNLSDVHRSGVRSVIEIAVNQAVYNVLLALDGDLAISSGNPKSTLELFVDDGSQRERLNDPDKEKLTSLFKE